MAAADADDRGYVLNMSYYSVFVKGKMKHELFVDSCSLFDTITTVHEPREYRLKKTVAKMRYSFESGELNGGNWSNGKDNLANCLTEWNAEISKRLNVMLCVGTWDEKIDTGGSM